MYFIFVLFHTSVVFYFESCRPRIIKLLKVLKMSSINWEMPEKNQIKFLVTEAVIFSEKEVLVQPSGFLGSVQKSGILCWVKNVTFISVQLIWNKKASKRHQENGRSVWFLFH